MNRFQKTCKAGRQDETLRLLSRAIVAANRAGAPDRVAYDAFEDRVQELGLTVPKGYLPMLMWAVTAADIEFNDYQKA